MRFQPNYVDVVIIYEDNFNFEDDLKYNYDLKYEDDFLYGDNNKYEDNLKSTTPKQIYRTKTKPTNLTRPNLPNQKYQSSKV